MVHQLLVFLIFSLSFGVMAQDERYYRQILNGELPTFHQDMKEKIEHQFNVKGSVYSVDLNGDGIEESIQPQKRDGIDYLEIQDSSKRKIFEAKLLAMGSLSHIYKVRLTKISDKTKALIVHLDEGKTEGRRFESTARIFLITFDNNDFTTMEMTQGPHMFHEKEGQREQYWRRGYSVVVKDIDNDGIREVVVEYGHIQRIMVYKGKGEWGRL